MKSGANWCGSWCSTSSCPVCSKEQPWNCYEKETCSTAEGNWCEPIWGGGKGWCSDLLCPNQEADAGLKCKAEPPDVKDLCLAQGGEPKAKKDASGCSVTVCEFTGTNENEILFKGECLPEEKVKEYVEICNEKGYTGNIETSITGCLVPGCDYEAEGDIRACQTLGSESIKEISDKCLSQGGFLTDQYDEQGCKVPVCSTEQVCYKVPEDVKQKCSDGGGEMIIKDNEQGCVVYSACLMRGDDSVEYKPVEKVPEEESLASIKEIMSEVSADLALLSEKIDPLITFYENNDDSANADRFINAKNMIKSMLEELEIIRITLGRDSELLTPEGLTEVRNKIRHMKDVLIPEVIYIINSTAETETGTKECGTNDECFQSALRSCTPASVVHVERNLSLDSEITGIEGERCVFTISAEIDGKLLSMTCKDDEYASGTINAEKFREICEGSLLEKIYSFAEIELEA